MAKETPSFVLPDAPTVEAATGDNRLVTISLDPELNLAFESLCGDRARSAVVRYMIATCLEANGLDIVAAKYSRIGATKVRKQEVVVDD